MEIDWFAYRFSFFFLTNNSFLFFLCFSFHFHFRGNVYVLFELNSVFLFNFHKPAFPPFFHSNPKRLWMVMSSSDCDCDCSPVLLVLLRRFSSPLLSKCVAWCAVGKRLLVLCVGLRLPTTPRPPGMALPLLIYRNNFFKLKFPRVTHKDWIGLCFPLVLARRFIFTRTWTIYIFLLCRAIT